MVWAMVEPAARLAEQLIVICEDKQLQVHFLLPELRLSKETTGTNAFGRQAAKLGDGVQRAVAHVGDLLNGLIGRSSFACRQEKLPGAFLP
jgi:hypothetical protein